MLTIIIECECGGVNYRNTKNWKDPCRLCGANFFSFYDKIGMHVDIIASTVWSAIVSLFYGIKYDCIIELKAEVGNDTKIYS